MFLIAFYSQRVCGLREHNNVNIQTFRVQLSYYHLTIQVPQFNVFHLKTQICSCEERREEKTEHLLSDKQENSDDRGKVS